MYQSIGAFPLPPSGTTLTFRFCRRHLGLIESLPWKDGGQLEKIKRRPWIRGSRWTVMFGMEDGGRQTADDMDGWTCCKGGGDIPCVSSSSDEQPTWRVGGDPTATLPDVSDRRRVFQSRELDCYLEKIRGILDLEEQSTLSHPTRLLLPN
ncbi:unnamed protein product [Linum trigynum]|uniref:Uncharacterized protein n=1 Tax=Linum trigynum TaxID=586398 RepID=A0AAV2ESY6_9ROSI